MFISLLALLILAVVAALGFYQGAVRLVISLTGLFLATILAFPLRSMTQPMVGWIGVKDPVWSWVWPPVFAFLIVFLIFFGVSFFVHRKVALFYKYRTDDLARIRWERVNKRLGVCIGLVMGTVWLLVIGLIIHVAGYLTIQVAADETSSPVLRYLNQAKYDLRSTGLEKSVAALDPMPPKYYEVADLLGLIYQNPILQSRLSQYPPFLTLRERPEFQEIAKDKDFNSMLLSKVQVTEIVNNPKTQALINNQEITQELLQQDLKDLRQYLETGKSPKYDDEKILGRWKLDTYATVAQERRKKPDMSASEMTRLKKQINELMAGVSFVATTDNKATLTVEMSEQMKQLAQAAATAQANRPAPPPVDPRYRQQQSPGARRPAPAPAPAPGPTPATVAPQLALSAQGTWERDGDKYLLKLQNERGRSQTMKAEADDEKLILQNPPTSLVFTRAE
jgi:phosphate/sulfate permease